MPKAIDHTCDEYNPDLALVCGKPAVYRLDIESIEDGKQYRVWKCVNHVKRYVRGVKGARSTITATKDLQRAKPASPKGRIRKNPRG